MHFSALVICPSGTNRDNAEDRLARVMAPYNEERSHSGIWDWYQVGGRFTGLLGDYDPELDPRNIEVCRQCNGGGVRNDAVGREHRAKDPSYMCNGCDGKGQSVKWPTQWAQYDGDIQPIECLSPPNVFSKPYYLITPQGLTEGPEVELLQTLPVKFPGSVLVVVDCHG